MSSNKSVEERLEMLESNSLFILFTLKRLFGLVHMHTWADMQRLEAKVNKKIDENAKFKGLVRPRDTKDSPKIKG